MTEQSEALIELGEHIAGKMPDAVRKFDVKVGELTVYAERDQIIALVDFLKRELQRIRQGTNRNEPTISAVSDVCWV